MSDWKAIDKALSCLEWAAEDIKHEDLVQWAQFREALIEGRDAAKRLRNSLRTVAEVCEALNAVLRASAGWEADDATPDRALYGVAARLGIDLEDLDDAVARSVEQHRAYLEADDE